MRVPWYIAHPHLAKDEDNADFRAAVSAVAIDLDRIPLRTDTSPVSIMHYPSGERVESAILPSIQYESRQENQALTRDEAIFVEVGRCDYRRPGLAFTKD